MTALIEQAESGTGSVVEPVATRGRNIPLQTADQVRVEMAKVYREMRRNQLDVNTGSKLVYVLSMIGKLIETSIIEKRLEQLEREVGAR